MRKRYQFVGKAYERITFSIQNGIQKGKGLDLGAEPPRIKLSSPPPPPGVAISVAEILASGGGRGVCGEKRPKWLKRPVSRGVESLKILSTRLN